MTKYYVKGHDIKQMVGQNGKAIDVKADSTRCNGMIMHICIPYSSDFEQIVTEYYNEYNPPLIIIHSSVEVGTTSNLYSKGIPVVHSPILFATDRYESLRNFRKFIGFDSAELALAAENHLRRCFNTALIKGSYQTELTDICYGMLKRVCKAVTFEIQKIYDIAGAEYRTFMEYVHNSNYAFATMNKLNFLLFNDIPKIFRHDFTDELYKLLPDDFMSAFFKLAEKSHEIQKKAQEKVTLNEIQEQTGSDQRSQVELPK